MYPRFTFFGHHKCATKYILAILRDVCHDCGLRLAQVSSMSQMDVTLDTFSRQERLDWLCYTNAQWPHAQVVSGIPGFHVIRDPRDILVSGYFSHLYSHETKSWPALEPHRKKLAGLTKHEGLMIEMEFSSRVFEALQEWNYGTGHILEVRFEELTRQPLDAFSKIFRHLNCLAETTGVADRFGFATKSLVNRIHRATRETFPMRISVGSVPIERLGRIVHRHRFENKAGGRRKGVEQVHHHYRKGVPGDWKNHLTSEHLSEFNRRFPRLLMATGYVDDLAAAS